MSQEGKSILESILGKLLGFDDGASDVLEHLLTIESREDLLEYLSQLLGAETPEVLEFVDNVGKFKRGEKIVLSNETGNDSKPPAKDNNNNKEQPPKNQHQPPSKNAKNNKNNKALQARRNNKKQGRGQAAAPPSTKSNTNNQNSKVTEPKNSNAKQQAGNNFSSQQNPPQKEAPIQKRVVEKSRPTRGKANIVCGCFGTKHEALTNCLYCGRISCVQEGYQFCPFCGYMIEEIKGGEHGNDASWIQKERLLRFDREFARRTQIFDDQADYQPPSTWMTEDEHQQAEDNQEKRMEELKRPKMTLTLS